MDFATARRNMVEGQLKPNRVADERLLAVMAALPREYFVPERRRAFAYADEDIALGNGRFLIEAMVLGRLIEALAVTPDDKALVIGSGGGYGAAVLAGLARSVVALDSDENLMRSAETAWKRLGFGTIVPAIGALEAGWIRAAPYDVILFDGATGRLNDGTLAQLAEGGRLAAVVKADDRRANDRVGRATLVTRVGSAFSRRQLFDAATPYLAGLAPVAEFVF